MASGAAIAAIKNESISRVLRIKSPVSFRPTQRFAAYIQTPHLENEAGSIRTERVECAA
jgi:hypothetical protein